jgi:hypothetical protein
VAEWKPLQAAHEAFWSPWVERRRDRRSRGQAHPIEDFLWEYYAVRGGRLLRWHPGLGVGLEGASAEAFPDREGYRSLATGRTFFLDHWSESRLQSLQWILNLQETLRQRPPVWECLGLHEWAMVYAAEDVRHPLLPLRLPHAEIREVVEELPLCCTHYDAFRFFSAEARPLNATPLDSGSRLQREQPGCLHANMDLFKWCLKLQPMVSSALTRDAFELALRARWIDMRASPYDVSRFGVEPIAIETPEGRRCYGELQRQLAADAVPIRDRLIEVLQQGARESPVRV